MTFKEAEQSLPNGFHDAEIEKLSLDYRSGTLSISMRLWVGAMGTPNQEEYRCAELRVNKLVWCSIQPPDPTYPFAPNGDPLNVQGDDGLSHCEELTPLVRQLPAGVSFYRFFFEEWNSFICIAGSDVKLLWTAADEASATE